MEVKSVRKKYASEKERRENQRQMFRRFCFELLVSREEKGAGKSNVAR